MTTEPALIHWQLHTDAVATARAEEDSRLHLQ